MHIIFFVLFLFFKSMSTLSQIMFSHASGNVGAHSDRIRHCDEDKGFSNNLSFKKNSGYVHSYAFRNSV